MGLLKRAVCLAMMSFMPALILSLPSGHPVERLMGEGIAMAAQTGDHEEPFQEEQETVADPLESLNRASFKFNDKLYFWVLKPGATVYIGIVPEGLRIGIRNAYRNIQMPMRVVNSGLQGKFDAAGKEIVRFVINSTLGIGGLVDVASKDFDLKMHEEDFGQTLGFYGMRPMIYINWPILGPSSLRDSIGLAGDTVLNPIYWLSPDYYVSGGVKAGTTQNSVSLHLGEYEDFKQSALDPYVSMRDAYIQNRAKAIRE
jgi:phospholipid-binding lipoprotein MlaA